MKIQLPVIETKNNSEQCKSISMKIGDARLIADLLRKHYQNPLRTMIQEYLSNARDAHREIGQLGSIKVSLPTKMNPSLIIRDFGPGLSPERLENFFCSYASSTKRGSDTQTGGFGIGSKIAWAYRSNFFIKNFFKGKQYLYEASIADHYEGALKEISVKETEEKDGLCIQIPIELNDVDKCRQNYFTVTAFWDNLEVTNLLPEENVEVISKVFETEDFVLIKQSSHLNHTWNAGKAIRLITLVDGVIYPIPSEIQLQANKYFQNSVNNSYTMVLKFKSGELTPTIAREELEENNKNFMVVNHKIEQIFKLINAKKEAATRKVAEFSKATDLKEYWLSIRCFFNYFKDCKAEFPLGDINLQTGRLHFYSRPVDDLFGQPPKVQFIHLTAGKKVLKGTQKQSWYDLSTLLPVFELSTQMSNWEKQNIELEVANPLLIMTSTSKDEFHSRVKSFLGVTAGLNLPNSRLNPLQEIHSPVVCEYVSCSSKEPVWSEKEYAPAQLLKHPWVSSDARVIPAPFLSEISKQMGKHGLLIVVPDDIAPNHPRMTLADFRNSLGWEASLGYLFKVLAKESFGKIKIIKNYGLTTYPEVTNLINHPLVNNVKFQSSEHGLEYSRIKDKVTPEFIEFLKIHDHNSHVLLKAMISLNEKVSATLVKYPELEELISLVQRQILPVRPSPDYLAAVQVVAKLKKPVTEDNPYN